ncbi:MAG: tetratricopeptide repeat protein, partial [Gaiellales bacterium]
AEPHLRRAANELPCAETLVNHANVLVELGRHDEADARYREAFALDSSCAEALWGLAELETQQGHTTSAADLRRRAVDLRPGIAGRCR